MDAFASERHFDTNLLDMHQTKNPIDSVVEAMHGGFSCFSHVFSHVFLMFFSCFLMFSQLDSQPFSKAFHWFWW